MFIKYEGARPSVSTVCSGRVNYYFGPENNYTCEVLDPKHAQQLLSSSLHKFVVVLETPREVSKDEPKPMKVEEKPIVVKEPKYKGRRKKNG